MEANHSSIVLSNKNGDTNQTLQKRGNMLKFKLVELPSEHACTGAYSIELRDCVPGPCFFSQALWVQLDDCTHLNSDMKVQEAVAQWCNFLLQSQLEELRSLQEQTECGCG